VNRSSRNGLSDRETVEAAERRGHPMIGTTTPNIEKPRRPFAVIVEGLTAVLLALAASAVLTRTTRAWAAATAAHAVALAGVLWGMVAVAAGRGPHTQLNDTYHRVMVVVLGTGRSCC
jgi:hypothetical protein